ncbi:phosphodiester glycosidase family protein [Anabaena sp. UHCC 0399]|uniref:phosphodiester glycosidase family protein n=1 Tax=Anabaena sp. UHCC 0399 TaxID=3110238 RepID=UPI002B21CFB3|nr:phosphodiester glycosidase family protein [Anabaena sp. UHCC 0399]MEA5566967.1 phosphodiester glycosidase family protein [Anabaena sp. UHCC 0399]
MVKMPNYCRQHNHCLIAKKLNYRLFQTTVSPLLAIALCLSATNITNAQKSPQLTSQSPISPTDRQIPAGSQISLNGRTLSGAWLQRREGTNPVKTYISDAALNQLIGVDLLSSNNPARQPIEWFSSNTNQLVLATHLLRGYRYLDVTSFSQNAGWQMQVQGNTLVIATPKAQVKNIRQSLNPAVVTNVTPLKTARIVLDLDRSTPWQVKQGLPIKTLLDDPNAPTPNSSAPVNREWTIILDAIADASLIQRYTPLPPSVPNLLKQSSPKPDSEALIQKVEIVNNQTIITLSVPLDLSPQITTINNPDRLVIDLRPDALKPRDINWATGLRWRQQFVTLGQDRFGIVWLEVNPRSVGLAIKPIWAAPNTLIGTAPLIQKAQTNLAVAAINAGYFNRNNRLPLGAIRRDGQWLSSPILNRGAIAWNDAGQFYFGRLTLQETLTTSSNLRSPILFLNSGYVQNGIARYTPAWGQNYTSLTDNERAFIVQNNKITNQLAGDKAGQTNFPIPPGSYLLVLRGTATALASQLLIGTDVQITSATTAPEFNRYPNIMGAGPLLLQNGQIVLDAKSEQFSNAFINQKASRSAICTTANNHLVIAAVHNRAGGAGPTLAEHAQLMKLLGCVNALNLDGGSSTSLYLGGQLLDRYPNTAARVHNGIGIFLQSR